MGAFLPRVGEDAGADQLVNLLLIGVAIVDGVTVPLLVGPEAIVRPEGIIVIEAFLLSLAVDEGGGLAVHLHAESGVELLLSLVERTHSDAYLHAHA